MNVSDEVGRSRARQAPAVRLHRERWSTWQGQRYPQITQQHASRPLWTSPSSSPRQTKWIVLVGRAAGVRGRKGVPNMTRGIITGFLTVSFFASSYAVSPFDALFDRSIIRRSIARHFITIFCRRATPNRTNTCQVHTRARGTQACRGLALGMGIGYSYTMVTAPTSAGGQQQQNKDR